MGLFERIFGPKAEQKEEYVKALSEFKLLTPYQPVFTNWNGAIYESALVRSAINAKAVHVSKLRVQINGTAQAKLQVKLRRAPNPWQTWSQFLYRCSTILDVQNTLFIVPVKNESNETIGIYPVLPSRTEFKQYQGKAYVEFKLHNRRAVCELDNVGIMTKFQYRHDFIGEKNTALAETMRLINMQNQSIEEAVKSGASHRFFARLTNFAKAEDLAKERARFDAENMSEGGGLLLFPNTYDNIKQVEPQNYVVDSKQVELIERNIYDYFGVNEDVLQNKAYGDKWNAFYESAVEPFAIQFSEVLTRMLFTDKEQANNEVVCTANRLQYMSNTEKLEVSSQLTDRGILNRDEAREIWNLPPLPNGEGQIYMIRAEYIGVDEANGTQNR